MDTSDDFDHAWQCYPHPRNRGGRTYAERLWYRMSMSEKKSFFQALPEYKAYLDDNPSCPACMFQTFVNQKRWEGWLESAQASEAAQVRREEPRYAGYTEAELQRELVKAARRIPHDRTAIRIAKEAGIRTPEGAL